MLDELLSHKIEYHNTDPEIIKLKSLLGSPSILLFSLDIYLDSNKNNKKNIYELQSIIINRLKSKHRAFKQAAKLLKISIPTHIQKEISADKKMIKKHNDILNSF